MRKLEEPRLFYDVKLSSWEKCGFSDKELNWKGEFIVLCATLPFS